MPDVLTRAQAAGVNKVLCIATSVEDARLITQYRQPGRVWLTAGIHPLNDDEPSNVTAIRSLLETGDYLAIGETGLDYYYAKTAAERARQRTLFEAHVALAEETGLPLIIHCRQAAEDILAVLSEAQLSEAQSIIHCFSEDAKTAELFLERGCVLSYSGIATFKNADNVREAVHVTPLDRMLIETDSPYLAPVPYRGRLNEPAYVVEVAKKIAELRQMPFDMVAEITSANFDRIFKISEHELT